MYIRFIYYSKKEDGKLLSTVKIGSELDAVLKTLFFCKNSYIPIELNTEDVADYVGQEYYIDSFSFVIPKLGGDLLPYVAVYVTD